MKGTEYTELVAFLAVAEEKNFRRAAGRLGLSPSAVSHTIRTLETRLQVRLFNRTTRSVSPTQAGLDFIARLSAPMQALESAVESVSEMGPALRGKLRINLSRLAAQRAILPKLQRFMSLYPGIQLDLVIDDHLEDVVAAGFDAGIRTGDRVPKDMIAARMTDDLQMVIVAAPSCFREQPLPTRPEALSQYRLINYRWSENGAQYRWKLQRGNEKVEVAVDAALTVNDINVQLAAAESGVGLALLEKQQVHAAIEAGTLIHVLPQWHRHEEGFFLYYPRNAFMAPAMRLLIDFFRLQSGSRPRG